MSLLRHVQHVHMHVHMHAACLRGMRGVRHAVAMIDVEPC